MLIEITRDLGGLLEGRAWPKVGEIVEVPDGGAIRLLSQGAAKPVPVPDIEPETPENPKTGAPETAMVEPPATRRGPGRPRKNP